MIKSEPSKLSRRIKHLYSQQVAADGCEDEAGDDHAVKK